MLSIRTAIQRQNLIAELVVAFIVILTGIFIIYDSVTALLTKSVPSEVEIGVTVAGISTVTAWFLSYYKKRVGNQIKSSALIAESKHSLIDAVSSLSVVAGLILTSLGFWYMDPIVGIVDSRYSNFTAYYTNWHKRDEDIYRHAYGQRSLSWTPRTY